MEVLDKLHQAIAKNDLEKLTSSVQMVRALFVDLIHRENYAGLESLQLGLGQVINISRNRRKSEKESIKSLVNQLEELVSIGRAFLFLKPPAISLNDITGVVFKLWQNAIVESSELKEEEKALISRLVEDGIVGKIEVSETNLYSLTIKGRIYAQKYMPRSMLLKKAIEVVTAPEIDDAAILNAVFSEIQTDLTRDNLRTLSQMFLGVSRLLVDSERMIVNIFSFYSKIISNLLLRFYSFSDQRYFDTRQRKSPLFSEEVYKQFLHHIKEFVVNFGLKRDNESYDNLVKMVYLVDVLETLPEASEPKLVNIFRKALVNIDRGIPSNYWKNRVGDLYSQVVIYNFAAAKPLFMFSRSFPNLLSKDSRSRVENHLKEIQKILQELIESYNKQEPQELFNSDVALFKERRAVRDHYPLINFYKFSEVYCGIPSFPEVYRGIPPLLS